MLRIAVLITCYNRREQTLMCLKALYLSELPASVKFEVILVDDGSTDGTSDAVHIEFPKVEILHGDGALFWNRGMHLAFDHALKTGFDLYLWLNDDTIIYPDALARLINTLIHLQNNYGPKVVVVGSTHDNRGILSYGGSVAQSYPRRFRYGSYRNIWDSIEPVECHVMNGNCVLIPHAIAECVGNLDPVFEHAMGDTDYALRVRALGGRLFVAPDYFGECSKNPVENTFLDRSLSLRERWFHIIGRKGLPPRSFFVFMRRHGGPLWLARFLWPYVRLLIK